MRSRRSRLAILPVLLVAFVTVVPALRASASQGLVVAQADPGDEANENVNQGDTGEEPEDEVGADSGQTEEAAEETGPIWTYQMARMALGLLFVLLLGCAFWYYRFVVRSQRGAA